MFKLPQELVSQFSKAALTKEKTMQSSLLLRFNSKVASELKPLGGGKLKEDLSD